MDRHTLTATYESIVQTIKAMLTEQATYFAARRAHVPAEHNLAKSRAAEHNARMLFKALYNNKPQIIAPEDQQLFTDYCYFLERAKILLVTQYNWFAKPYDQALTKKCRALKKETRNLIKKYFDKQKLPITQPTLL